MHPYLYALQLTWFICKTTTFDLITGNDLTEAKSVPKQEVLNVCDTRAIELWLNEVLTYLRE